jgi:hypothetical protein
VLQEDFHSLWVLAGVVSCHLLHRVLVVILNFRADGDVMDEVAQRVFRPKLGISKVQLQILVSKIYGRSIKCLCLPWFFAVLKVLWRELLPDQRFQLLQGSLDIFYDKSEFFWHDRLVFLEQVWWESVFREIKDDISGLPLDFPTWQKGKGYYISHYYTVKGLAKVNWLFCPSGSLRRDHRDLRWLERKTYEWAA